jgi:tetratricopeptide (TPR) repeat protein
MRKLLCAGVAIAAVLTCAPGVALAAKKPDPEQIKASELSVINAILRQGRQKAEKGDWAGAKDSYQSVLSNPSFPKLSAEMRHFVYYVLAMAEFYNDEYEPAYIHMVAAAEVAPKEMDASSWIFYARLAAKAGKTAAAGTAAVRAVTDFPDELKNIESWRIFSLASDLEEIKDDRVTYQKYLEALRAAQYVPKDDFSTSESLWFDLFAIYADRGEDAKAQVVADELTEPYTIARRQFDKRYVRFAPKAEDAYAKALAADIADAQAMVAKHPAKIEGIQSLANKLMNNNRLPEALKVIDEALAKADAAPKDKPAFEDVKEYHAWSLSTRASILQLMGRNDDALAAQTKARDIAVAADEDTVSHRVNLGGLLNELGKPANALTEVKDVFDDKTSSDYGVMAAEEVRACAHAQLGDKAGLAKSLEFMRAHTDNGETALQSALLCANEMDEAARRLIARLDDPLKRGPALLTLQTYLPRPQPSAWQKMTTSRFAALLARPDVQAAIAKYGSVRNYPVFGP